MPLGAKVLPFNYVFGIHGDRSIIIQGRKQQNQTGRLNTMCLEVLRGHTHTHSQSESQAPCICVNWQPSTLPSVLCPCTFSTTSLTQRVQVAAASTWNGATERSAPHYSATRTIPCIKTDHWGIQAGMDPQKQRYVVFLLNP